MSQQKLIDAALVRHGFVDGKMKRAQFMNIHSDWRGPIMEKTAQEWMRPHLAGKQALMVGLNGMMTLLFEGDHFQLV